MKKQSTNAVFKKPDWEYWRHIRIASLKNAILLSFDLEPDHKLYPLRESSLHTPSFRNENHQKLYEIAINHIRSGQSFLIYESRKNKDFGDWEIDLPSFGAWAKGLDIELPPRFPVQAPNSESSSSQNTHESANQVRQDNRNYDMKILLGVEKKILEINLTITKLIAATIQDAYEKNGMPVSKAHANVMATLIRPHDACLKDLKSRWNKFERTRRTDDNC